MILGGYLSRLGVPSTWTGGDGGSVRVTIDGVDRTEFLHYGGGRIGWNLMRGNRGTCSLPFIVYPGSLFLPVIGQYIEIFDGGQREWAGTIETVDIGWYGDDGYSVRTATGVTLDSLIDGMQLDKEQIASLEGSTIACGVAFSNLFTSSELPRLSLGTIEDGPDVRALNVTSLKDAFDTLAKFAGKIWYVDSRDLTVNFHDAGLRAADWTLEDQETSLDGGILWESMRWTQSRTDFADTQVIQLPMQSMQSQSATFSGNGSQTLFTFPDSAYPQYVMSATGADSSTTPLGHNIQWVPGSNQVSITPAMPTGQSMVVKWLDASQVIETNPDFGSFVGHKARRYVRTRTFTQDGTEQEAIAMLARYAMLPSQLVLSTDKPGITIARKWTIAIDSPAAAGGLVNGLWQVVEVEAEVVPGLDQDHGTDRAGRFRYTLHLVNFYATAIFEADGSTTTFALPQEGISISSAVYNAPSGGPWASIALPNYAEVTPAPPAGSTVVTQYQATSTNASAPDVQPFTDAWQQMFPDSGLEPLPITAEETPGEVAGAMPHTGKRDLTLRDLTVRDDCAPHTTAYHAGVGYRVIGILRKTIESDLEVTLHIGSYDFPVTIAAGTSVDDVQVWPLMQGSPPADMPISDLDVMTADITASDGSKDVDCIAQFTIQWNWTT